MIGDIRLLGADSDYPFGSQSPRHRGASGFGLATARELADRGVSVVIADVSEKQLERAMTEDPRLVPMRFDVTDSNAVAAGVSSAIDAMGGLDTLVLCAGVIHVKQLSDVAEQDWDSTIDVNLKGSFLVSQAAAPSLCDSGRGRIVAIASDAGRRGYAWLQAYCASKFGLIGLIESLAIELAPFHVTANAVCPASCPTTGIGQMLVRRKMDLMGRTENAVLESIARSYPLARYVEVPDVTAAILYFISDQADFLTGLSLDIDGGFHLGHTPGLESSSTS